MMIKGGGPGSEARRLAAESTAAFSRAADEQDPKKAAAALEEAKSKAGDAELAAAYTHLQRAVGVIAVLLPANVAIGNWLLGDHVLRGSISAYYYTHLGDVFVGSLCALAVFFLSYNYKPLPSFELDNLLSTIAAVAAVGVAVFPTARNATAASGAEKAVSTVHLCCAGGLFFLLGVFARFRFTKTNPARPVTREKRRRNRLYRVCGDVIFGAIALVLISNIVGPPHSWHALFWLETICVEAFGVSWLVKGGIFGLLVDKPEALVAVS